MGLMPLEFKDCLNDSPYFRQKLQMHEQELDHTNSSIKALIKEVKDLYQAARNLSRAKRNMSNRLNHFRFDCIGNTLTDDEIVISGSLREFAKIIDMVEDERERMLERSILIHSSTTLSSPQLERSYDQIIRPLETFRKLSIGGAKEGRKKFEKQTQKFCQSQERYLNLSTKKDDQVLQEADACVEMEQRHFVHASLDYVFLLQEVQERKKFEFVETLMCYMYSWLTFYHEGHEVFNDCKPYMQDLQVRLQRTRDSFESTRAESVQLKNKMLEVRKTKAVDPGNMDKMYTRQGYLFLMEKKAFGTTWTKHYCQYQKENRIFTMIPYNQTQCKITSTETIVLRSCIRRMSDSIDKRFCFDLTAQDKPGVVFTLQALSEEDRKLWMDAMDGKEPMYAHPSASGPPVAHEETSLDEPGQNFILKAIAMLEGRGLEDQGLYRLVGVSSKVTKMLQLGLDRRKCEKLLMDDPSEWEVKTITSAIKQYFRNLPDPLMTYKLHSAFIQAAKQEKLFRRVHDIHRLVHMLPSTNFHILKILILHLVNVARKSDKNLMTISNLGVCFGPTLLRPEEETVAAIMDIKFCNIVVEILIEYYTKIFCSDPEPEAVPKRAEGAVSQSTTTSTSTTTTTTTTTSSNRQSQQKSSSPSNIRSSHNHHSSSSSSSTTSSSKHLPVLQKVVTSFTTSEPQTVHFGMASSQQGHLQRSEALSHLKTQTTSSSSSYSNMSVPPPPSATQHWNNNNTASSLATADRNDGVQSTSSSSESLSSRSSRELPQPLPSSLSSSPQTTWYVSLPDMKLGAAYPPTYRQHIETLYKRQSLEFLYSSMNSISGSQSTLLQSSNSSPPPSSANAASNGTVNFPPRKVRTLYACVGENDSELSFEPNQVLTNVRPSREPGWLEGTLNGRTGLVPENYVENIEDKPPPPLHMPQRNTDV
ncbi:rho GTPase-activating protein 26-like isoform X16 [Eriocheir sinensis]|uniref:rho GTPase-activating protein 26-like isoform X16 n=1 Tax=Eriocheir sinensis TaxID=95602 RepID=UPI0021C88BD9|nr:rho GTPase-activating protein 26-like isoform X16 [Eriocheir sinensis]